MKTPARKKIAVVVPKYGLVGGGERFAAELTVRLAENSYNDIHVFANQWKAGPETVTFHKVRQITFPKWLTTLSFAWFAHRKIMSMGFDLVHAHDRLFRADLCSMHFIPHAIWVREVRRKKIFSLFDLATIALERRMLAIPGNCRQLLPVSSLAACKFRQAYPAASCNVEVMHPGVDDCFFQVGQHERDRIRAELNLAPDVFVLLFVSMNFELKGLDQLLGILNRLRQKKLKRALCLLVVGKGNQRKYQKVADALGVGEQIRFLGVREDMPAIYRAADLLALLSGFDTFGMVVSEAMAAELPVMVSPSVGACDLVREGENGFVVERDDVGQAAEIIAELAMDVSRRIAMGRVAKLAVTEQRWSSVAERVQAIYDQL